MRKIDLRLIPVLSILYLLAFLDRTNIANAAVYNLSTELGMARGSNEYNTALTIFFGEPNFMSLRKVQIADSMLISTLRALRNPVQCFA